MQYSIAFALAAAELIAAHSTFQSIQVNGVDQGQHTGVRTPSNANNPIYDVTSSAMICNGGTEAADTIEVSAGDKLGLQWHHNDGADYSGDSDEPIAASHHGPIMVYMAPAESNGEGAVWTKIYEDGLEGGEFGIDRFITNKGLIEVTVPDLADGEYLIRPEMIGLHEATGEGKAQFYNGCGQLKISGGSGSLPSEGTDMTKAYSASDPGVLVNIYPFPETYTVPGPAVWDGASSGSGSGSGSTPATPVTSTTPSATSAAPIASSAVASSAPVVSSTPVASSTPAPTATVVPVDNGASSTPAPMPMPSGSYGSAPSYGSGSDSGSDSGSGSSLPQSFTIDQFISWLKEKTSGSSSKVRRHARAFAFL